MFGVVCASFLTNSVINTWIITYLVIILQLKIHSLITPVCRGDVMRDNDCGNVCVMYIQ